jgi:hypothetical protein
MLVGAIPMGQFERRIVLEHLSAEGAVPMLLVEDLSTKRRRRLQRQRSFAVLNIRFPWRIERVGVALNLDGPLRFAYLLHADDLFSCGGVGDPPRCSRSVGKVARSEPASRCVWVTECRPPIQPSPDEAGKGRKRLAPDDVTMVVRPSP